MTDIELGRFQQTDMRELIEGVELRILTEPRLKWSATIGWIRRRILRHHNDRVFGDTASLELHTSVLCWRNDRRR